MRCNGIPSLCASIETVGGGGNPCISYEELLVVESAPRGDGGDMGDPGDGNDGGDSTMSERLEVLDRLLIITLDDWLGQTTGTPVVLMTGILWGTIGC